MIIESWLNERVDNKNRGVIFSTYIMITLAGVVGGQMMVASGDIHTTVLFMIVGILYCVAMLPTTLSTAASPQPLKSVKLDVIALYRNSPIAFVGMVLIGIANGAFGTLGAVFGAKADLSAGHVALMMSLRLRRSPDPDPDGPPLRPHGSPPCSGDACRDRGAFRLGAGTLAAFQCRGASGDRFALWRFGQCALSAGGRACQRSCLT